MRTIHTIGHSTLESVQFTELLRENDINCLVDIRSYPASRHCPQFGKDAMAEWLPEAGIEYVHLVGLGGRKHTCADHSPNRWWTHPAFRSYADYALTDPFTSAFEMLRQIAEDRQAAIMCAESQWWKCHRRIVTDHLLAAGYDVQHIMGRGQTVPASMSSGAIIKYGSVIYPPEQTSLFACVEAA